jgi:hypothetical protein
MLAAIFSQLANQESHSDQKSRSLKEEYAELAKEKEEQHQLSGGCVTIATGRIKDGCSISSSVRSGR